MTAEWELAMERLLDHLAHWVVTQPEWPLLFNAPRQQRKEAARRLADAFLTIPPRQYVEFEPNREQRRRIMEALRKGQL